MTLKFDGWPWKTIGHICYTVSSLVHHFKAMGEFKLELQSGSAQFRSKSAIFLSRVTLKFDGLPWKTIGHLLYTTSSLCVISKPSVNSNLSYSPETLNSRQNWQFFVLCDLQIWRMTLKNNRAPLLSNIEPSAFHHHMWIQIGVTVRKRLSWVLTSVTLTFDLWP